MSDTTESKDTILIIIYVLLILIIIIIVCNFLVTLSYLPNNDESIQGYININPHNLRSTISESNSPINPSIKNSINLPLNPSYNTEISKCVNNLNNQIQCNNGENISKVLSHVETINPLLLIAPLTNETTSNQELPYKGEHVINYEIKKTDLPEKGITKLIFYHMNGCGHCTEFIKIPQSNGKTKFETLQSIFSRNNKVQILDFKYGRDPEAAKYHAFPTVKIITENGTNEYEGSWNVEPMVNALNKIIAMNIQEIELPQSQSQSQSQSQEVNPVLKKSDLPEKGITKLIFYHMNGCGHCTGFISIPQANGKTKFETLQSIFSRNNNVQIFDFQYGRDPEAAKYHAFPTVKFITDRGTYEYEGSWDVEPMAKALSNIIRTNEVAN